MRTLFDRRAFFAVSFAVFVGMAIGCAAAAVAPERNAAALGPGDWVCYAVDGFPDVATAASGARSVTDGMNRVAPSVPSGTVVTPTEDAHGYVCVKY